MLDTKGIRPRDVLISSRCDVGPAYRAHFVQREAVLVVLLCGGDKSTQAKAIKHAKKLADEL